MIRRHKHFALILVKRIALCFLLTVHAPSLSICNCVTYTWHQIIILDTKDTDETISLLTDSDHLQLIRFNNFPIICYLLTDPWLN